MSKKVFVIDGARTPFMRSLGAFSSLMAHKLGSFAVNGLMNKLRLPEDAIDYACMGCVIAEPKTSNIAREIVLESKLSKSIPAHTVTMACISSNVACTSVADMIEKNTIQCGFAGGAETFSDLPIRYSWKLRHVMLSFKKAKSLAAKIKLLTSIKPSDLKPEIPSANEFSVDISMGQAGDQLAAQFKVSRADADEYALLSHKRALLAWNKGYYQDQIVPVSFPPHFKTISEDDGPRPNSTKEMLLQLPAAFNRFGINTAANSSFFSDGASAVLLASLNFAESHGLKTLAQIIDYVYVAGDPQHELLLGPALAVPKLLQKNNLTIPDIAVWEVHEAFAGQVLAVLKALASKEFCRKRLGLTDAFGEIPLDKMNAWGGSLSLGHPFGATGARLVLTAAKRIINEDAQYAVVTGCAAGGLGSAILLKRTSHDRA